MLALLSEAEQPEAVEHWSDDQWAAWEAELASLLPDADAFLAHGLRSRYLVWESLLSSGPASKPASTVLQRLREGCKFGFVNPYSKGQQQHPRYSQNLDRISRHLAQVYGPDAVPALLNGERAMAAACSEASPLSASQPPATVASEGVPLCLPALSWLQPQSRSPSTCPTTGRSRRTSGLGGRR